MAATTLTERYALNLHGVLSCYDRIIVTGTLPGACYAGGMTSFLFSRGIRIFDYPKFAEPLRDRIRERAQEVCDANGVSIEHVNKSHIRKEDLVARVLAERGNAPGLVHVISSMESCPSYKPWLDKSNGHVFLRGDTGKCLHCYFYFIDEEFGLCYLRVPTWAPFGLQFYCNGHSALACSLKREGIEFVQEDNAFLRVADLARAQALADAFNPEQLHRRLTRYVSGKAAAFFSSRDEFSTISRIDISERCKWKRTSAGIWIWTGGVRCWGASLRAARRSAGSVVARGFVPTAFVAGGQGWRRRARVLLGS